MPSVEFIVRGIPVSAQAKNTQIKQAYRTRVVHAAQAAMNGGNPFDGRVQLDLKVFSADGTLPDGDNVIKLVQDALQGVVYGNDRQVRNTSIMIRSTGEPVQLVGVSPALAAELVTGDPIMYVRVTTDVDWSVIS